MTPHHLHATAAAWSLQRARAALGHLADEEAAQIAAEQLEAPALLRSPVWGGRHATGGHGDPTPGMLAVADRPARRNRWAEMAKRADGKLDWIADTLHLPYGLDDGLTRIIEAVPAMQPGTASTVARHLQDEDRWIREAVGVGPARAPLPGVACPHCAERQLYVQTAGPIDAWTVICATNRLCVGQGCPCGMPGAVEGVAHIWPRAAVIGAVAGAAPTQPAERTERMSTPDRACPDYPNECLHPWAHARTYDEVKAAAAKFEIDDTVDIAFRRAVVVDVSPRGAIQVQNAGCSFWVHPDDNDTEVTKS